MTEIGYIIILPIFISRLQMQATQNASKLKIASDASLFPYIIPRTQYADALAAAKTAPCPENFGSPMSRKAFATTAA